MRQNWIHIANFLTLVALTYCGCGPAIPVKGPPVSPPKEELKGCKDGAAYQLGVRIIPAFQASSNGPFIPTPQAGVSLEHPTHYERGSKICRDQVSFPQVLNLSENLFFVWKEKFLNKKILNAWATHRIHASNGNWKNETTPIQVVKDLKEPRFYISINYLFKHSRFYQDSDLGPSDTQTLRVDFLLEDHKRKTVEIRFKAKLK